MAWNQSGKRPPQKKKMSIKPKYVLAFVLLLLVGIIAIWFTNNSHEDVAGDNDLKQVRRIKTVRPAKASVREKKPEVPKAKTYAEMSDDERLAYYKNKYGNNPPENLKPVIYFLEHPPKNEFKMRPSKYRIFKHSSERSIAALLMVEPGNFVVRPITFDERFNRDFVNSMVDKIEFSDEDTDEQRALKQAVIDTKKEIAERVKQGETPSEILNEASKQLYALGQYRHNLDREVAKMRNDPNTSDEDVKLYVEAANKMLADKGLKPLRMPNMVVRHAELMKRAKRAAQNTAEGKK